jgi:hypothetical protein
VCQQYHNPEYCPPFDVLLLEQESLFVALQQYFGMASDTYIHFTPEYFGQQTFSQHPIDGGKVWVGLEYFASERDILFHAVTVCALHGRILLVFDAVFDGVMNGDAGWRVLQATFDQLAADLLRDLPLPPSRPEAQT